MCVLPKFTLQFEVWSNPSIIQRWSNIQETHWNCQGFWTACKLPEGLPAPHKMLKYHGLTKSFGMSNGECQRVWFCLLLEFQWTGSATNRANPSSIICIWSWYLAYFKHQRNTLSGKVSIHQRWKEYGLVFFIHRSLGWLSLKLQYPYVLFVGFSCS